MCIFTLNLSYKIKNIKKELMQMMNYFPFLFIHPPPCALQQLLWGGADHGSYTKVEILFRCAGYTMSVLSHFIMACWSADRCVHYSLLAAVLPCCSHTVPAATSQGPQAGRKGAGVGVPAARTICFLFLCAELHSCVGSASMPPFFVFQWSYLF